MGKHSDLFNVKHITCREDITDLFKEDTDDWQSNWNSIKQSDRIRMICNYWDLCRTQVVKYLKKYELYDERPVKQLEDVFTKEYVLEQNRELIEKIKMLKEEFEGLKKILHKYDESRIDLQLKTEKTLDFPEPIQFKMDRVDMKL